jgi:hypothetical protein
MVGPHGTIHVKDGIEVGIIRNMDYQRYRFADAEGNTVAEAHSLF